MGTVHTKNDAENVIRQNIPRDPVRDPDVGGHLNSGYEEQVSTKFYIPPCGIEDCDKSLFKLFDKTLAFTPKMIWSMNKQVEIPKPLVVFASGERYAMSKKKTQPPLDRNRNLLLPAISIRRTDINQTMDDRRRGMNQSTGIMTLKRKLAPEDRDYQNFINKLALQHMVLTPTVSTEGQSSLEVDQRVSKLEEYREGGLLYPNIGNNIYEVIEIPQPQFFTATYEVVFWTSYTQHMNYMIEKLNTSVLPQDRMFKLVTEKGYWFMAYLDDVTTGSSNYDDFKDSKRIIRYTFTMRVKGYILAPDADTDMVPIRRWVSAPSITFDIEATDKQAMDKDLLEKQTSPKNQEAGALGLFSLTDVDTSVDTRHSQARTVDERIVFQKDVWDPITRRKKGTRLVTKLESNERRGETVFRATDIQSLEEFIKTS